MDDIGIWRAANLLIDRHYDEASLVAGIRADEMAELGEATRERFWRLILPAVLRTAGAAGRRSELN
jgi:hypothetical protein